MDGVTKGVPNRGGRFFAVLTLIAAFHNGAQPIDQMVFQDVDGA